MVLNPAQYLELLIGPKESSSAFSGDIERHSAWRQHRTSLLPVVEPGSRPWAWWEYEAPALPGPREDDFAFLQRWGLLDDREKAMLGYFAARSATNPCSQVA